MRLTTLVFSIIFSSSAFASSSFDELDPELQEEIKEMHSLCKDFGKHVRDCKKFSCKISLAGTQRYQLKHVVGIVDGKCQTKEEMIGPNDLICNFPINDLEKVARFNDSMGFEEKEYIRNAIKNKTCHTVRKSN